MTNLYHYRDDGNDDACDKHKHKASIRSTIHKERRLSIRNIGILLGLLLVALWIGDWMVDADNALRAAPYRMACAIVIILYSLFRPGDYTIAADAAITYACLMACELLILGAARSLTKGYCVGLSGIIFMLTTQLVLCSSYPFFINLMGTVFLAIVPLLVTNLLFGEEADNQLYILAILPFCLILLIVQYRKRRLIVERQYYLSKSETIEVAPGLIHPRMATVIEFLMKFEKNKCLEGKHSLLRIRIMDIDSTDSRRCRWIYEMNQEKIKEAINNSLRGRDISANLEWNEYFCLLIDTDETTAAVVAERLRSQLQQVELGCPGLECFCLEPPQIVIERYSVDSIVRLKGLFRQFGVF